MIAKNLILAREAAPLFGNPSNYDLQFEDISCKTSDGVNLEGWLIKGETYKVIVQSHFGLYCSRVGYTVLMYDMRNHGESDSTMDGYASYGLEEAKDIITTVDFITNHSAYKNANIGLLSICMGQDPSGRKHGC